MEETKSFFLSVTQRIFSNWMALKLAVEHGMGPVERAIEFCSYIMEVIYMNDGLTSDQIAIQLEDYMDDYFDTNLEDNSSIEVAAELLRFYKYCVEGNSQTANTEFEKLLPQQVWLISEQPTQTRPMPADSDSSSDESMDLDMNDKEKDEWTVIRRRRQK